MSTTVLGFDHVAVRVQDLERAIDFYARVLGLPIERRRDDLGLVHLRAGDSLLDLVAVGAGSGRVAGHRAARAATANLDHVCLRIAEFDAGRVAAQLAAVGVEVGPVAARYGASGEAASIYLRDPDGNGLELRG